MKQYCFQLSTGIVICTPQQIVYTEEEYAIDNQCDMRQESIVNGTISIGIDGTRRNVEDIVFKSEQVICSWIEE